MGSYFQYGGTIFGYSCKYFIKSETFAAVIQLKFSFRYSGIPKLKECGITHVHKEMRNDMLYTKKYRGLLLQQKERYCCHCVQV